MINAVSNSTVPHITITIGASFGAGNYGMSGRAYDPRFVFAWPGAKLAVMGADSLLASSRSWGGRQPWRRVGRSTKKPISGGGRPSRPRSKRSLHSFFVTARLYDDGIIDPRDTRRCSAWPCRPSIRKSSRGAVVTACSGCEADAIYCEVAYRQPRRDSGAHHAHGQGHGYHLPRRLLRRRHDAPFVRLADEAVRLPGSAPTETYLRTDRIIDAARLTDADAIHPGYGFLAENAMFARACTNAGLIFVGPPARVVETMGAKISAKRAMAAAGVPVLPHSRSAVIRSWPRPRSPL